MTFILNFMIIFSFVISFLLYIIVNKVKSDLKERVEYHTLTEVKKLKIEKGVQIISDISFWIMLIDFVLLVKQIYIR